MQRSFRRGVGLQISLSNVFSPRTVFRDLKENVRNHLKRFHRQTGWCKTLQDFHLRLAKRIGPQFAMVCAGAQHTAGLDSDGAFSVEQVRPRRGSSRMHAVVLLRRLTHRPAQQHPSVTAIAVSSLATFLSTTPAQNPLVRSCASDEVRGMSSKMALGSSPIPTTTTHIAGVATPGLRSYKTDAWPNGVGPGLIRHFKPGG